jgi:hypothetical protein
MSGRALAAVGGTWRTTKTAAGSAAGTEATSLTSASTPPAEAPTTTMSWSGMDRPPDQWKHGGRRFPGDAGR